MQIREQGIPGACEFILTASSAAAPPPSPVGRARIASPPFRLVWAGQWAAGLHAHSKTKARTTARQVGPRNLKPLSVLGRLADSEARGAEGTAAATPPTGGSKAAI